MNANPGLTYPKDNALLTAVKDSGYFLLFDRNAESISLLPGGDINQLLAANNSLMFIFGSTHPVVTNITGTPQDIEAALIMSGFTANEIDTILSSGITSENVATSEAQEWINIFKERNKERYIIANYYALNTNNLYSQFIDDSIEEAYVGETDERDGTVGLTLSVIYNEFKNWFRGNFPGQVPTRPTLANELSRIWGRPINNAWHGIKFKTTTL